MSGTRDHDKIQKEAEQYFLHGAAGPHKVPAPQSNSLLLSPQVLETKKVLLRNTIDALHRDKPTNYYLKAVHGHYCRIAFANMLFAYDDGTPTT